MASGLQGDVTVGLMTALHGHTLDMVPPLLPHKKSRPNFHLVLTYNLLVIFNI